ncbi:MAG TPA: hypothetical protein PKA31_01995 [Candidatus Moranbacteria bacterium]|nr:hypothetical protein [Candidatus Moranbacteria bacterium]
MRKFASFFVVVLFLAILGGCSSEGKVTSWVPNKNDDKRIAEKALKKAMKAQFAELNLDEEKMVFSSDVEIERFPPTKRLDQDGLGNQIERAVYPRKTRGFVLASLPEGGYYEAGLTLVLYLYQDDLGQHVWDWKVTKIEDERRRS